MLKSLKKWLDEPKSTNHKPARKRRATRPFLERLEDRVTPSVVYQGGPVMQHPQLQALYLGQDWGQADGGGNTNGDQVIDIFDKLPVLNPSNFNFNSTTYSEFDVKDLVPALEGYLQTLATSNFMDMLTALGYGVGQGSWLPGGFDPIDLGTGATELPNQAPASAGLFGANGIWPPQGDPASLFYAAQGYTSTYMDASKAPTVTDTQIEADLENSIISGDLTAPTGQQIYVVFVQPGVIVSNAGAGGTSATAFLGYHSSFIDPQFFGSTVINYAVIPFHDYGNNLFNNGAKDNSEADTGLINATHLFPIDTGSTDATVTGFIGAPLGIGPVGLAGTAADHNVLDEGQVQVFLPGSTPPNPNIYLGYNGMSFDSICETTSHEVAEASTDPQVVVLNPSDPKELISNVAWNDPVTGAEIGDVGQPRAVSLVTNPASGEIYNVQKLLTQFPQSLPAGTFGGENAAVVGPTDYSPASSGYTDARGIQFLFDRQFDGHITFSYRFGGAGTFIQTDVTALTGAPLAVSDVSAVNVNGTPLVFYRDAFNRLDVLYFPGFWTFASLDTVNGFGIANSYLTQGVPTSFYINFAASDLTSAPTAIMYAGGLHVFDINPYGHIEDTYWTPYTGWAWADISLAPGYSFPVSGAQSNSVNTTTTDTFVTRLAVATDGYHLDIAYKDMFNELQLIEYSPATGWIWDNLNQVFFSTLGGVTFFSPLVGMQGDPAVADFNGSTFMFYRDVNNNVQMVAHNFATNVWSHRSINAVAAVPLAADSPVVYVAGGTMHVIFQTPDTTWQLPAPTDFGPLGLVGGRIIDAFTTDGVNWKRSVLTNIPNTTPPGTFGNAEQPIYGTPSVIVNGNSIAVIFINGVNSNIYDINFYGATVSLAVYFDLVLTEIDFTPGGVPTTSGESLWGPFLFGTTF